MGIVNLIILSFFSLASAVHANDFELELLNLIDEEERAMVDPHRDEYPVPDKEPVIIKAIEKAEKDIDSGMSTETVEITGIKTGTTGSKPVIDTGEELDSGLSQTETPKNEFKAGDIYQAVEMDFPVYAEGDNEPEDDPALPPESEKTLELTQKPEKEPRGLKKELKKSSLGMTSANNVGNSKLSKKITPGVKKEPIRVKEPVIKSESQKKFYDHDQIIELDPVI